MRQRIRRLLMRIRSAFVHGYESKLLRTAFGVAVLSIVYYYAIHEAGPENDEDIDQATVWLICIALVTGIIGLLLGVVHWKATNCGLLALLTGMFGNFSIQLLYSYGHILPYFDQVGAVVRGSIAAGAILIAAAFVKYMYDGYKLPPPWNSMKMRRNARREEIRRMQEASQLTGLDDL